MFWFKVIKHFINKFTLKNAGKLIVEAKDAKEANQKMQEIFKEWPSQEDESFLYLSLTLYGPYTTKEEAEYATIF